MKMNTVHGERVYTFSNGLKVSISKDFDVSVSYGKKWDCAFCGKHGRYVLKTRIFAGIVREQVTLSDLVKSLKA